METLPHPTASAAAALSLAGLRLGYWTPAGLHLAVDGIDLEVRPRERLVVIGPSGCGKSTLLKAVAGFVEPLAGTITVGGRVAPQPGPDRAVVFQEFDQLFPWRTVLDNVAYPLRVNGASRRDSVERAHRYLAMTRLDHAADRFPHELSGGMKQRVAIARALALEPSLLLMDEPFGALDAITRQRLQVELAQMLDETHVTLLLVTHSIDEALVLGDRVVVLAAPPQGIVDVVDVSGISGPDDAEYAEKRIHLRHLLVTDADDPDEELHGGHD
jgi:NitT/TauT family transport system ATP-binding protein